MMHWNQFVPDGESWLLHFLDFVSSLLNTITLEIGYGGSIYIHHGTWQMLQIKIFPPRRVVYQHTIAFKFYKSEQDDMATPLLRESWKESVCHLQPLSREGNFAGQQGKGELGK